MTDTIARNLSPDEYRVWCLYASQIASHGYSPALKDVAAALGYSQKMLRPVVTSLVRKRYLRVRGGSVGYEVPGLVKHLMPAAIAYITNYSPAEISKAVPA